MNARLVRLVLLALLATVLAPVASSAQVSATVTTIAADGPPSASVPGIRGAVDAFRARLGVDNGVAPPMSSGRREVTWDEAADADAAPAHLPADYFNTAVPKGLLLDGGDPSLTGSAGYMVSGTTPAAAPGATELGNLNRTYPDAFTPFDENEQGRIFTAIGTRTLDVRFLVPGTDTPGAVSGFGAVFLDVDKGNASRLELFDIDGRPLASIPVPAATGDAGLSFVGATYPTAVVGSARLTMGDDTTENAGSPNDAGQQGPGDIVALDNLIFGEPQPRGVPSSAAPGRNPWRATVTTGAAAANLTAARAVVGPLVTSFTGLVGGQDNGTLVGTQPQGYRAVTFDDLPAAERHPSRFPGDYFHRVSRRGLQLTPEQIRPRPPLAVVSAAAMTSQVDSAGATATGLGSTVDSPGAAAPPAGNTAGDADRGMATLTTDGNVLLSPGGGSVGMRFTVPGSATHGVVAEIALLLSDVDSAGTTVKLYDIDDRLLHTQEVPVANGSSGLSFVGMRFARPVVHRAVVSLSAARQPAIGERDVSDGGTADIVGIDRIIYGEPYVSRQAALIALEDNGATLHTFNAADTMTTRETRITGLVTADGLVALERDQVTGTVYGLGRLSTLYCLNRSGAATLIRELDVPLEGSTFGFDYDPAARRLITIADSGQRLSLNRFEGSVLPLDALTYAGGDPRASTTPEIGGLALSSDGTGWVLDGDHLASYDGRTIRSAGSLGTHVRSITALEQTADGTLWTITDANGPGLVTINPTNGSAQRIGPLPEPMIGLIGDGEFGPCHPSPVAVTSSGEMVGPRISVSLSVVNDQAAPAAAVSLVAIIPPGFSLIGAASEDVRDCQLVDRTLTCPVGTVAPGAQPTLELRLRVGDESLEAVQLDATVRVDGEDADHTSFSMSLPPSGFALPTGPFGSDDVAATAVAISQLRFDAPGPGEGRTADFVVVSRDDAFADSLAGSGLTGNAPLLFASSAAIDAATLEEIVRVLGPSGRVYLLGGEQALAPAVEDALAALGYEVIRLAGETRVETSIAVARVVLEGRDPAADPPRVLLARATGPEDSPTAAWADSVAAGGYAARSGAPVLLSPTSGVHEAVRAFLAETAASDVVLLGGPAALSPDVEAALPGSVRVAGDDRAATAAAIARELWEQPERGERRYIIINSGSDGGWAFGLAAAGLSADADAPVLVVVGTRVPEPTLQAVDSCYDIPVGLTAIGGSQVTDAQLQDLDSQDTGIC